MAKAAPRCCPTRDGSTLRHAVAHLSSDEAHDVTDDADDETWPSVHGPDAVDVVLMGKAAAVVMVVVVVVVSDDGLGAIVSWLCCFMAFNVLVYRLWFVDVILARRSFIIKPVCLEWSRGKPDGDK